MPHFTATSPHCSKTPKPTLFSTFRARNGGAPSSFLTSDNTTTMDATPCGSDTEEEDNSAQEREYLDKMTDDTNRKVETVFGASVDVWKSSGGTVYADVKESVKKKRRDEAIWGKKRKERNKGKARARLAKPRKSTPPDNSYSDDEQADHAPHQAPNPPATPTQSEWEIFPVSTSQYNDLQIPVSFSPALHLTPDVCEPSPAPVPQTLPATTPSPTSIFHPEPAKQINSTPTPPQRLPSLFPYRPRTPTGTVFHRGSAGVDPLGNLKRPYRAFRPTSMPGKEEERQPSSRLDGARAGTGAMGPRQVVSGSFGSFEGSVGRFDERGYRLGRGGESGDGGGMRDEKLGEEGRGVVDLFKGRYWLRQG